MPGVSQMNGTGGRDFSGERGCMAVGLSLCLSEIKLAHTDDEVRQEMA